MKWTKCRKLEVILQHFRGASEEEIFSRYEITAQELRGWIEALDKHGADSLSTTKVGKFRKKDAA